ncbi:hypothetical protein AB0H57_31400 [Micromonospora sp. NPDC050686]|uniref:hypothetical protein n=1 Tax=Micromonospora sp. NPDC050686 TaxID=3154631 RepID=UPI0033DB2D10
MIRIDRRGDPRKLAIDRTRRSGKPHRQDQRGDRGHCDAEFSFDKHAQLLCMS